MIRNLITVCCVLSLAAASFGADTIFLAEAGTGATTVYADWNGSGYDDVHVVIWAFDPGDEDASTIRAYQVAMHDAIPLAGARGDVRWVGGTATVNTDHPDWLHDPVSSVPPESPFTAAAGTPPWPSMAGSILKGFDASAHALDDTPKYLSEITFEISPDAKGRWIIRPYCSAEDSCATGPNCVRSGGTCAGDSDCPRYSVLGDLSDTCDHDGIDHDDGFIMIDQDRVAIPYLVEPLEIVIPGRCCDGLTCLGNLNAEECEAAGGEFDEFHTCFDGCVCGDGLVSTDEGEECDDGNLISGDGCDRDCIFEVCGNGVLQQGSGEECDDGNTADGDGCTSTCHYPVTACSTDLDCVFAHDNVCDWDDCDEVAGTCRLAIGNIYGDVCGASFTSPANGAVNVTDVLCTLTAFGAGNLTNCPNADVAAVTSDNCPHGNGIVNLTDVLKILDAFGAPGSSTASFFCDCPLNP